MICIEFNVITLAIQKQQYRSDREIDIDTANILIADARTPVTQAVQKNCSTCNVRGLCMPTGVSFDILKKLDKLVFIRKRLKTGDTLYHAGSHCHALYAVKAGFMKTENLHEDGRTQITGFYMAGEMFGFDGLATDAYMTTSVALEDSEICIIPIDRIENAGSDSLLQHHLYKLMSREIIRDHTMMMLLGSMQGEERLATFLLNLSHRLQLRGYSPCHLVLRMKREEIGSYLGMKLETVSRVFTKFQDNGLLNVHQKDIQILDLRGLKELTGQHTSH